MGRQHRLHLHKRKLGLEGCSHSQGHVARVVSRCHVMSELQGALTRGTSLIIWKPHLHPSPPCQARVPVGRAILELPAGMMDEDVGDFVGTAAREVGLPS